MRLKSLLFVVCFSMLTNVFAINLHMNPNADSADQESAKQGLSAPKVAKNGLSAPQAAAAAKGVTYPGYCEIEIINNSFTDVRVYGTFDDGSTVDFNVYRYESPHYISLFYYFYCHSGMYITVQSPFYTIYSGWANVNSTILVAPYFNKQAKVTISDR
ncbi:MAG: hypothetical protein ACHP65_00485 [Legionellales bacterium]